MPLQPSRPWRARVRQALLLWHRWFGLGAALWLLLLAITGSAITFYDELDTWLNPDLRVAPRATEGRGRPVTLDQAVSHVQRAVPGFQPWIIDLPNRPGET